MHLSRDSRPEDDLGAVRDDRGRFTAGMEKGEVAESPERMDWVRCSRLVRHYVRTKTVRNTNTVDIAAWSRAEENLARGITLAANCSNSSLEQSRCRCIRRHRWRPKVVPFEAGMHRRRAPDSSTLEGEQRGRAEINFPGLCKGWYLRFVESAGIKVGSAPNGPRVARKLHAGNHRERRTTLYM